jgi:Glyoxalase/Bleomycin resistance protein/Dioxygenase superfamily
MGAVHEPSASPDREHMAHCQRRGGPTPDKPSVTLSVPANPDSVNSFMNIRVADIQACYELWRSRGAEFITEPKDKYGETRCYIRDPDGYIIEVGQSKPEFTYG